MLEKGIAVMSQEFKLLFLTSMLVLSGKVEAFEIKNCQVTFKTIGKPVLVMIEGKSGAPCQGTIDPAAPGKGQFTMKLDQLDTGIVLRNKHLKETYLQVQTYPEAKITLNKIEDFAEQTAGKRAGKASNFGGEMTLKTTTRAIDDGVYQIDKNRLKATFSMAFPDYGMEQPAFMGIKVVDRIQIQVEMDIDAAK